MKKIIVAIIIAAGAFGIWKYLSRPDRQPTLPEQAASAAADYVPTMIDTKKQSEQKINDAYQKQNDQLQNAMNQ